MAAALPGATARRRQPHADKRSDLVAPRGSRPSNPTVVVVKARPPPSPCTPILHIASPETPPPTRSRSRYRAFCHNKQGFLTATRSPTIPRCGMADELDALRRITQRRTRAEREWLDEIRQRFTAGHSIDQIAAAAGVRYEVGWSPKGGRSFGGPLRSVGLHPRGAGLGFRPSRHHAGLVPITTVLRPSAVLRWRQGDCRLRSRPPSPGAPPKVAGGGAGAFTALRRGTKSLHVTWIHGGRHRLPETTVVTSSSRSPGCRPRADGAVVPDPVR